VIRLAHHVEPIVITLAALIIGGSVYRFTVPAGNREVGSGVVSGYAVTGVHYALNATAPPNIDSLTFTVTPPIPQESSGEVTVETTLAAGARATYPRTTNPARQTVTCVTTSPPLAAAALNDITVIAGQ
jgi:hypothetical protein